jgi:hypothetical protein
MEQTAQCPPDNRDQLCRNERTREETAVAVDRGRQQSLLPAISDVDRRHDDSIFHVFIRDDGHCAPHRIQILVDDR